MNPPFQIKGFLATLEGDGTFEHIEHFVLGPVRITRGFLALSGDVFHERRAIPVVNFACLQGKVDAKAIQPSIACLERSTVEFSSHLCPWFLRI